MIKGARRQIGSTDAAADHRGGRHFGWSVYIEKDFVTDAHGVIIAYRESNADAKPRLLTAKPLELEPLRDDWRESQQPFLYVSRNERDDNVNLIQALLDAAWDAGFRPTVARDHDSKIAEVDAELKATNKHLEDMQGISRQMLAHILKDKA